MANRNPRDKLPKEEKSRTYSLRLDPKNPDDAWVIDAIEFYRGQGVDFKTLFKDLLANAEGRPVGNSEVKIKAKDIAEMMRAIRDMKEMLESGNFTAGGETSGKRKSRGSKTKDIEYTDSMRNTFEKFVSRGFSADDLEGEDE